MNRVLDPDDEAASAVLELGTLLAGVAQQQHHLQHSFRVLGGNPAMSLGRLATQSIPVLAIPRVDVHPPLHG